METIINVIHTYWEQYKALIQAAILGILFLVYLVLWLGRSSALRQLHEIQDELDKMERTVDTVYSCRTETLRVSAPKVVAQQIVRHDTVFATRKEFGAEFQDSAVILPIEQKEYSDSCYSAWVSGYKPNLDSIHVYQKQNTVTITKNNVIYKKRHWGIGPAIAGGWDPINRRWTGTVGIGIQYSIIGW